MKNSKSDVSNLYVIWPFWKYELTKSGGVIVGRMGVRVAEGMEETLEFETGDVELVEVVEGIISLVLRAASAIIVWPCYLTVW